MKTIMCCLLVILTVLITCQVWANDKVNILTEEFPPFQYTENGKIIGASAEIVEAVMEKAGVAYEMISYPWARSYAIAQEQPNTLIFSISRRPDRESLFKWVGIIVPSRYSVFSLKSRSEIKITTMDDMKKYKIGTTTADARESFLVSKGFKLEDLDRVAGKDANVQNYKKLLRGRIDLWPMPDAVAFYIVKAAGDDPNAILNKVFPLEEISTGGYFLAASLKTPDEIVLKIKTALESLTTTDSYKAILTKWGISN